MDLRMRASARRVALQKLGSTDERSWGSWLTKEDTGTWKTRERARAESLQTYALAYLEEARAGLAVARLLPGEHTPEALGSVLERLREHAADRSSRRNAAREVGVG